MASDERVSTTRFKPGQSGNPAGRPKGARNRTTVMCEELLGADAGAIMRRLVQRAKKGDGVALRLAVERLVPVRASRDRLAEIELPSIERAEDIVQAAAAVIGHAAAGDITLSEAREFMQLLDLQRQAIETGDLAVRISVLERQAGSIPVDGSAVDPDVQARCRRLIESEVDRRARERAAILASKEREP